MPVGSWLLRAMCVVSLLALGACGAGEATGPADRGAPTTTGPAGPRAPTAAGEPVAVADVKSLAGRWAGLMDLPGGGRDVQYLEVMLREDGTYTATSARTIGVMDAQGTIAVRDGHLVLQGERGARGTARLYSHQGEPTLMVDMTGADQRRTTARLQPQR
ncbi:MAG TPA: hypothetical protein VF136_20180 [Methylomirabilota bacterium]